MFGLKIFLFVERREGLRENRWVGEIKKYGKRGEKKGGGGLMNIMKEVLMLFLFGVVMRVLWDFIVF